MKKLLLAGFILIGHLTNAQDFATYCSKDNFEAGIKERFSENAAVATMEIVDGVLVATKKDLVDGVEIKYTVPNFFQGGIPIENALFRFKIKLSYNGMVRIKAVSDSFGNTYDVPFLTNKSVMNDGEYFDYVFEIPESGVNKEKFQELIIVVTTDMATPGTVSIKDFNYGGVACGSFEPTGTDAAKNVVLSANVFPNPSSEKLNVIATLKNSADVKISLVNTLGTTVYAQSINDAASINTSVDVSTFAKGLYTLLYTVNGTVSKSELVVVK